MKSTNILLGVSGAIIVGALATSYIRQDEVRATALECLDPGTIPRNNIATIEKTIKSRASSICIAKGIVARGWEDGIVIYSADGKIYLSKDNPIKLYSPDFRLVISSD